VAYLLSSLLVGVSVADLFTMIGASLPLLAASWLPARRATRVGPIVALRTN
jgi:ABC-type lipoprotein release transport system permease subunit